MKETINIINEPDKLHHLTCVVNQLLPVFSQPQIVRIIMDSWLYQRKHNGMQLYGYVIMEEHLHFLAQAVRLDLCLLSFLEQTAAAVEGYLKEQQLERFSSRLLCDQDGGGRVFRFWQGEPEVELMADAAMIVKALEYIHINPVKRGYVDDPAHWRYSSARDYAGGVGLMEIDHWCY